MIWPYVALYLACAFVCAVVLIRHSRAELGEDLPGELASCALAITGAWLLLPRFAFAWSARRVARWGRK